MASESQASSNAENIQVLMTTFNDTLSENRQMRENLRSAQQELERTAFENTRLKNQLRRAEKTQETQEKGETEKSVDLENQIKETVAEIERLRKEVKKEQGKRSQLKRELGQVEEENFQLKEALSTSILKGEKEELVYLLTNNTRSATKALKRLSDVNVENQILKEEASSLHYQMGNIKFKQKQYQEAAEHYKKALAWNPGNAWVCHNLGIIYDFYLKDRETALLYYEKYLEYKPVNENAQKIRQRVLDITMLKKVQPNPPLQVDFEAFHQDHL